MLHRVFAEGFRVFFLSAGVFALFAMLAWVIWLTGAVNSGSAWVSEFSAPPHLWHAHEMVFGYGSAALGGFLLTAVPNWTGTRTAPQTFLVPAAGLWLAGRLAIWFSGVLPAGIVAFFDLAFLPLIILKIALQLAKRPKPQNIVFVGFLSLIWAGNLMVHLEWMGLTEDTLATGLRVGLLTFCAMIAVLGGRVTPAFTRNAMKRAGLEEEHWPESPKFVERPALLLTVLIPLAMLVSAPQVLIGGFAIGAGVLQLVRLTFWRTGWTLTQPILWSLHLGVAMLGVGLILWGSAAIGFGSEVAALHVLGIGCVGGMTLAVMSRAILGHTGRDLIAPPLVAVAYAMIALAAVLRWIGSELSGDLYLPLILVSGAAWIVAYLLYLIALGPAMLLPRQSG